jgi:hypothetical protein
MQSSRILPSVLAALCLATAALAQAPARGPMSKIYVADTEGNPEITSGKGITTLAKKAVYRGEGTSIETKADSNASIVLSNGTGLYFDVRTRTGIRSFVQEPFRPNRTDMDDEPSISRTHLVIDSGVLGLSTSRMAPGSALLLETALASIEVHGRQAVVQAADEGTIVSLFDGGATIRAGSLATPYEIKADQQLVVRPGRPGQPETVEISDLADGHGEGQRAWLYERVLIAEAARKLVYFYMESGPADNSVTLFEGGIEGEGEPRIVVVPVIPPTPPVQPTVSAANLYHP